MNDNGEVLENILKAARKHPQSRVAQGIRAVEEERSPKNIVLLLIELAEHPEYIIDFDISLKYYLDLYASMTADGDVQLNEVGLLLVSSSKIYARRVEYVNQFVENLVESLSTAEELIAKDAQKAKKQNEQPKRARKRLVDENRDRYAVELAPKKYRKLNEERRFAIVKVDKKVTKYRYLDMEEFVHPTGWLHSTFVDFENDEDVDSKRNYKLFTYHIERRYNTLVPDINFRLHFKVKDYIDEEEERMKDADKGESVNEGRLKWPPLSEEYVKRYLRLENRVLEKELRPGQKRLCRSVSSDVERVIPAIQNEAINTIHNTVPSTVDGTPDKNGSANLSELPVDDSGLGGTFIDSCVHNASDMDTTLESSLNVTPMQEDSGISDSMCNTIESNTSKGVDATDEQSMMESSMENVDDAIVNMVEPEVRVENNVVDVKSDSESDTDDDRIRVHLPHLDDEGVYFSDLDEHDQRMLSPTVIATDVLPCVPNKTELRILIDDEIRCLLNLPEEDDPDAAAPPRRPAQMPIQLNILKIHEKFLRKRSIFKPGLELEVFIKARLGKRSYGDQPMMVRSVKVPRLLDLQGCFSVEEVRQSLAQMSPFEPDIGGEFFGFPEGNAVDERGDCDNEDDDMQIQGMRSLSRDSGVGIDVLALRAPPLDSIAEEPQEASNSVVCDADSTRNDKISDETGSPNDIDLTANETFLAMGKELENDDDAGPLPITEEDLTLPELSDTVIDERRTSSTKNKLSVEDELELLKTKTKIQAWHEHLRPILSDAQNRHHFDVYEIGTEIIETLKNSEATNEDNKKCATFEEVVKDKGSGNISRYFLSSLLLVNQQNIKFDFKDRSYDAPMQSKDVKVVLLSTERQSVSMEDNIGMVNNKPKTTPAPTASLSSSGPSNSSVSKNLNVTTLDNGNTSIEQPITKDTNTQINLNHVRTLTHIQKYPRSPDADSGFCSDSTITSQCIRLDRVGSLTDVGSDGRTG